MLRSRGEKSLAIWNGLYVAGLYVALRTAVAWCSPPGYENSKATIGTLALSLCILSALALCFYKALRLITVFLVVSFQALLDISKYTAAINEMSKTGNYFCVIYSLKLGSSMIIWLKIIL